MANQYKIGVFQLNNRERQITRNGEVVHLQPKSFDLLSYLLEHAGNLVSKQQIMDAVWGDTIVTENSLAVCIRQIRALFEDHVDAPEYIETVPGSGYRFIHAVTKLDGSQPSVDFLAEQAQAKPFSAYTDEDPFVFVAYSHKDLPIIYPELEWLNNNYFNVWYDEGLEAGMEWSEELATRIKHSSLFLYFVTPDSAESQNCRNEVNYALKNKIPTLIVHLKKTELPDGLSLSLSAHQAILRHEMTDQEYRNKLAHRISVYIDHSSTSITHAVHEPAGNARAMWLGIATVLFLALGYLGYERLGNFEAEDPDKGQTEIREMAIAILPLTTKGKDASAQFYATELVDRLRSQFRRVPGVSVRAQTSSQAVLSAGYDLPTIAKKLNVQHIIQGSLELQGSELDISLSLADDLGVTLWSQQFHSTSDKIETTEVEITRSIAQHLGIKTAPISTIKPSSPTQNLEAHKAILTSRHESAPEGDIEILKAALLQAPGYAPLYAELANAYAWGCWGWDDRDSEFCALAIKYAEEGLKLDPKLAEAIAVRAFMHAHRYEYHAAQAAIDRLAQLPDQKTHPEFISSAYLNLGRLQLTWDSAQTFYQNDPLNPTAAFLMSFWAYQLKNDQSMAEHFERIALEMGAEGVMEAYTNYRKHRVDMKTAIERARLELEGGWGIPGELAESWVRPNYEPSYRATALREFREWYERGDIRPTVYFYALLFFYQTDAAMEMAFDLYDQRMLNTSPIFLNPPGAREFRSHPRFVELMEYIGIASYWDDVGWPHFCEKRGGSYFCGLDSHVQ